MGVPWTKKINKQKDICPVINVDKPNPKSLTNQKKKVILAHIGEGVLVSDWEVLGSVKMSLAWSMSPLSSQSVINQSTTGSLVSMLWPETSVPYQMNILYFWPS